MSGLSVPALRFAAAGMTSANAQQAGADRCYTEAMATAKKGQLVAATEWWKHLRWTKRAFWKRQRQADKREAAAQRTDA